MDLPEARVGPYVRALATGLNQLAPHGDYPPLVAALAHLRALDPALSGELLLPAEVDGRTGMPTFPWMQRAIAEKVLSGTERDPSGDDVERAARLDPALARRLAHRRSLRAHLRESELLPPTRLHVDLRRSGERPEVSGAYDRLAPDGRWLRIRFVARQAVPAGSRFSMAGPGLASFGPFHVHHERLTVDGGLQHLFTRHFASPLLALRDQLGAAGECEVLRLSRSWVGPFWFPGVQLPPDVSSALGQGLLLQLSTEVVAEDVHHEGHLDPFLPPGAEIAPPGQKIFRERRFAASAGVMEPLAELLAERGLRVPVASIEGRARPRTL